MSPPPHCPVAAGFALPAAVSASALLMLSSLSLHTLALHGQQRSRSRLQRQTHNDAQESLRMAFLQQAHGPNACLLQWPSSQWHQRARSHCSAAHPQQLQHGHSDGRSWQLQAWQPQGPGRGRLQVRWRDGSEANLVVELRR